MADHGLVITWGELKPGRERKALHLWGEAIAFNDQAVAEGRIEGWDAILLEPSSTFPAGAMRYYGTAEQMGALAASDDFLGIVGRGQLFLSNFGYRRFIMGQAVADAMTRAAAVVDTL